MAGHQFGAKLMALFTDLVLKAATSQRAAAAVLENRGPIPSRTGTGSLGEFGTTVADAAGTVRTASREGSGGRLGVDHGPYGAVGAVEMPGDRGRSPLGMAAERGPLEHEDLTLAEPDADGAVQWRGGGGTTPRNRGGTGIVPAVVLSDEGRN